MVSNVMRGESSFDNVMIANSTLNGSGVEYAGGVVGAVYNSGNEVFKVIIVNVNITGSGRTARVGGVAGRMQGVRIKEVYIGNTIVNGVGQESIVGGVAGSSSDSSIQNVTVIDSNISGKYAGGIVGNSRPDNVSICHVIRAKVNGEIVGGVIGYGDGSKMQHATVANSTIIAHTENPSVGGRNRVC
ncbi:MAG: hypothetical protein QS721_15600 [Candidatus Endonucleobacter sp. (ex Gigantidas childressi)]|nr:hypothetical protein [Candidatus Endonucleobacter sp. (ex Gigantidas childressi)]